MATLVLTAVGTALGGPVGGAIGSLLGQSVDQQLFGSTRHGPRLGDLAVQTSTYGTQIPRVYGTMRVAGSVIWATDLQESSTQTGAKGQPDTTVYSYSVSIAVALSSRPVQAIKRIWADGKLLRGASGDFKVSTDFRFHDGSEDQTIDPLIGSIEGIAQTPAYRGLALAVFENLELAEYGNRIPFLTFEVEADPGPPEIGALLTDASEGFIQCEDATTILGYAAHGPNIRDAIEPLVRGFGLDLFDDGLVLRSPPDDQSLAVDDSDLGCSAESRQVARIERTQSAARSLPAAFSLSYYDASRDYQTSQMRGSLGEAWGREKKEDLPAVLEAGAAKALVHSLLCRAWSQRDQLTLRLPPRFLGMKPGSAIALASSTSSWQAVEVTIEGLAVRVHLRPASQDVTSIIGDAGRASTAHDSLVAATSLALFEVSGLEAEQSTGPTVYIAASSPAGSWTSVPVEITASGTAFTVRTSARKTVLGSAVTALPPAIEFPLDPSNSVEVELIDQDQWLESHDDEALVHGANLAILGSELIQFGTVEPIGPGRFQLSRLLRGRQGTEGAMDHDLAGESFAMFDPTALRRLELPPSMHGMTIQARARGLSDIDAPILSKLVGREELRPPSPFPAS